jgi:predicted metal-dependent hydrolase
MRAGPVWPRFFFQRSGFFSFRKTLRLCDNRQMRLARPRSSERLSIAAASGRISVVIKRNVHARRLILRVDESLGLAVLVLPSRTSLNQGERFLRDHLEWLEERLKRLAAPAPFADGTVFPLRGTLCRIRAKRGRGLVTLERGDGEHVLSVPGEPEFLARRVTEWLRREARRDLERAVAKHAEALGRKPGGLRIADPKSRWGSCSSKGVLTFSWRLVLAPPRVLDYLAAHETAHLREMNHGKKFWAWVEKLDPDYETARAWLNKSGVALSAVGRRAVA